MPSEIPFKFGGLLVDKSADHECCRQNLISTGLRPYVPVCACTLGRTLVPSAALSPLTRACFTIGVVMPIAGLIYGDVSTTSETLVFEPVMAVQFVPEPLYCQS